MKKDKVKDFNNKVMSRMKSFIQALLKALKEVAAVTLSSMTTQFRHAKNKNSAGQENPTQNTQNEYQNSENNNMTMEVKEEEVNNNKTNNIGNENNKDNDKNLLKFKYG